MKRREIDEVFLKHEPILKHNLPVEILGDPPPPKGDPVFELKPLPDTLNMLILMRKRYIMLLLVLTFQSMKKRNYGKLWRSIVPLSDILLTILRASVLLYVSTKLNWRKMLNELLIINGG